MATTGAPHELDDEPRDDRLERARHGRIMPPATASVEAAGSAVAR
jgi:hypothetical protein